MQPIINYPVEFYQKLCILTIGKKCRVVMGGGADMRNISAVVFRKNL